MLTLSALDVRKNLGDILNRIAIRHDEYVIERKGQPMAAMVPMGKFEAMQRAARAHLLDVLDGESLMSDEEAMELANEAKSASRES
jgi:PHD/YefM family antitoxin component YafN of YafNO toxin-antitoxin module